MAMELHVLGQSLQQGTQCVTSNGIGAAEM